jgi:hypothetical protein
MMTTLTQLRKDSCILGYGNDGIPIIACWRISYYQIGLFCPECKIVHKHGWAEGNPNGHRVAHCNNQESRFYEKGYYLVCQGSLGVFE